MPSLGFEPRNPAFERAKTLPEHIQEDYRPIKTDFRETDCEDESSPALPKGRVPTVLKADLQEADQP
jgi:hypothetical protein